MFSHSSIVHNAPIITYDIIVSPEQGLNANKTGKITVTEFDDDDLEIDIKHGIKTVSYKNQGVNLEGDSSTSCDNRGQIKHFYFETLMQETVPHNIYFDLQKSDSCQNDIISKELETINN